MKAEVKKTILIILTIVIVIVLSGYFLKPDKKQIKNVVLISIDTCRADYLSCYGYNRKTTPNIDAVAEHAVLFENTYTPVPMTLPAHSSMFTGTIPPYHGLHDNLSNSLSDSHITLAEVLRENGFTTSAIISSFVLDSRFGLDQGFDYYNDQFEKKANQYDENERIAEEVSHNALDWLDKHKNEKFFMFLHYYDPHKEYSPPEPFRSSYSDNPYAGEIAYTDHCIGQVIGKLKELGLYDSTLLIITGDHGEMLGSHGEPSHSFYIYQPALKVPLIIKLNGKQKGLRIKGYPVSIIDIFPTICSVLGINPPENIQGMDLVPLMKNAGALNTQRSLYCESFVPTKYNANSLLGVINEKYKYIQTTRPELYNLRDDPEESRNIIKSKSNVARILQDELKQIIESAVSSRQKDSKIQLDQEAINRLESLGYTGGHITEEYSFNQDKKDPKDIIEIHKEDSNIGKLIIQKKFDQAKELCLKLIDKQPGSQELYLRMYTISKGQGDYDNAINYLQKVIELSPNTTLYKINLAKIYFRISKYDLAIELLQQILDMDPTLSHVHAKIASAYIEKKDFEKAIYHLDESLKLDPYQTNALNQLVKIYHIQNNVAKKIEYIKKSLSIKSNQPEMLNSLAVFCYSQGNINKALEYWQLILEYTPDSIDALNNIAWIKAASKDKNFQDPFQAIALAKQAYKLTEHQDPKILDTLAVAYAASGDFQKARKTAEQAIKLAELQNMKKLAHEIQGRIELYKQNKTYIEDF